MEDPKNFTSNAGNITCPWSMQMLKRREMAATVPSPCLSMLSGSACTVAAIHSQSSAQTDLKSRVLQYCHGDKHLSNCIIQFHFLLMSKHDVLQEQVQAEFKRGWRQPCLHLLSQPNHRKACTIAAICPAQTASQHKA